MIAAVGLGNKFEQEVLKLSKKLTGEDIRHYNNYDELKKDIKEVEIILNKSEVNYDVLKEAENLKFLMSYSAGVDSYDGEFFRERSIILTNASGVHIKQISEQIMGAIIYFSRRFDEAVLAKERHEWIQRTVLPDDLEGKKLLIIGAGQIGKEIARKAEVFDMEVYGIRFSESKDKIDHFKEVWGVKDLKKHIKGFDYIVSVLPSTKETRKMINKEIFDLMDKDCVFMNIGRGDTVVEKDFLDALDSQRIRAGYSDVFEVEPLDKDARAWDTKNLLITPHNGGLTPHYDRRVFELFEKSIINFREEGKPLNIVNLDRMY